MLGFTAVLLILSLVHSPLSLPSKKQKQCGILPPPLWDKTNLCILPTIHRHGVCPRIMYCQYISSFWMAQ